MSPPYATPPLSVDDMLTSDASPNNGTNHNGATALDENRRKQAEKKRQWRRTLSQSQLKKIRDRDAERKRAMRVKMSEEQKRLEREKDALRKAFKRQKEKDAKRRASVMSIDRILNP